MVDRNEIVHLGDLVKVELQDVDKYIHQVDQILNYFERLDSVRYENEGILRKEIPYESLREDRYAPFRMDGKSLIDFLKKSQNNYVRAPKMI